jgi:N-acetylglucosaminyl-diphospho-decaprenol L-rhamnosyltransferase
MTWSIVVVTWRSAAHLEQLVASMNRHLPSDGGPTGGSPELVVVENASGEDPEDAARGWQGAVSVIREPRNLGFGAAANHGAEAATGDVVVLLNPDTELLDDGIVRLAAWAADRDAIAAPRVLNADRSKQPSASGPVVGPWPWFRALVPGAVHPAAIRGHTEPWRLDRPVRVAWLTGVCLAARRDVLVRLGPFDPAIEMYAEDLDLGLRAAAAGLESWFRPDLCAIVHHGGASTELRFDDREGADVAARYRVAVIRRAHGVTRERRAARAERLHLALRIAARRTLRRDPGRDPLLLAAARSARDAPDLPAPPEPPAR